MTAGAITDLSSIRRCAAIGEGERGGGGMRSAVRIHFMRPIRLPERRRQRQSKGQTDSIGEVEGWFHQGIVQ